LNPNQGISNPNASHLSHHYNLQQYTNSAYCNGSSSSNDNENMGYVNSQIQSYSNPPASWYPSPNSDPRFASKIISLMLEFKNFFILFILKFKK
jgi:hypothetical protein